MTPPWRCAIIQARPPRRKRPAAMLDETVFRQDKGILGRRRLLVAIPTLRLSFNGIHAGRQGGASGVAGRDALVEEGAAETCRDATRRRMAGLFCVGAGRFRRRGRDRFRPAARSPEGAWQDNETALVRGDTDLFGAGLLREALPGHAYCACRRRMRPGRLRPAGRDDIRLAAGALSCGRRNRADACVRCAAEAGGVLHRT